MNKGPVVTAIIATLALSGVVVAFMQNASPYVTIAQARQTTADHLHLAGNLDKSSISNDLINHRLTFKLKDVDGDVVTVVHSGDPPGNMGDATQVVAIGQMKGDVFYSDKLLVKCPSKYETESKLQKT